MSAARHIGELPLTIKCPDCQQRVAELMPGRSEVSRAFVQDIHGEHEPMHPSVVGVNHRDAAKKAWDTWAALDPFFIETAPR